MRKASADVQNPMLYAKNWCLKRERQTGRLEKVGDSCIHLHQLRQLHEMIVTIFSVVTIAYLLEYAPSIYRLEKARAPWAARLKSAAERSFETEACEHNVRNLHEQLKLRGLAFEFVILLLESHVVHDFLNCENRALCEYLQRY